MKFNRVVLMICFCFLTTSILAQKTLDKPYQKWSNDEAMRILIDSPWAQTYQSVAASAAAAQQQSAREQSDQVIVGRSAAGRSDRDLGVEPIVVRLNSALPIRQALARLQQLGSGYDKMSDEQKSKFDESQKDFLNCKSCENFYVVTITKFVKKSGQGVDDGIFQYTKFEDLKNNIKLTNDKGEERELIQFIAPKRPGEAAVLFFKRTDEKGNSLLTNQSKQISLVFNNAYLGSRKPYVHLLPRRLDFKASKLLIADQPAF